MHGCTSIETENNFTYFNTMPTTRTNKSPCTFAVSLSFLCSCHLYARVSLYRQAFLSHHIFTPYTILPCLTLLPQERLSSWQQSKVSVEQPVTGTHSSPKEQTRQVCIGRRVQDISFQPKQT